MVVIIVNVVVLAMPYLGNSVEYTNVIQKLGYVFAVIYNIEAVIKIGGLRRRYFEDNWNRMDLFIVVTNDFGILLENVVKLPITDLVVVGRVLRVSRIFKLVRGNAKGLQMLLNAINTLFFNLINIMGLLWLVIFIFAICGMNMFHGVII